jgi:hypothetical protein
VDVAVKILNYAVYRKVEGKKPKAKKARVDGDADDEEKESEEEFKDGSPPREVSDKLQVCII